MFQTCVFLSPVAIGVFWSTTEHLRRYMAQQVKQRIIAHIPVNYHGAVMLPGAVALRRLWRQLTRPDGTHNGAYTAPCCAIAEHGIADIPYMPHLPQLPEDVLYLIAVQDYKVYASMMEVNKSLNTMLRQFDAWGEFVDVVQERKASHTQISESTIMRLKALGDNRVYTTDIKHGTTSLTRTNSGRSWWNRTEEVSYYLFNVLHKYEYYVSERVIDDVDGAIREVRHKEFEREYSPNLGIKRLSVARKWDKNGKLVSTTHYRGDERYDPSNELAETLVIAVGLPVITAFIVDSIVSTPEWRHFATWVRSYGVRNVLSRP